MEKITIKFNKVSYQPGDLMVITINISALNDRKQGLASISINIDRLDVKRNMFVLSFGIDPVINEGLIIHEQKIPENFEDGIYFVNGLYFTYGETSTQKSNIQFLPNRNYDIEFFSISKSKKKQLSKSGLDSAFKQVLKLRNEFHTREFQTESASKVGKTGEYRVFIFGIGCLLNRIQELEGYSLCPINDGLSYSNMNDAVNSFLTKTINFTLPLNSQTDQIFRKSAPIVVMDFKKIKAIDRDDALNYAKEKCEKIFSILGHIRGKRPSRFANVLLNLKSSELTYDFEFPGYKGNLFGDVVKFNTARRIEYLSPILKDNPWLKFVFDSQVNALSELDVNLKYLRFWSILELIAKKEISNNRLQLMDFENNEITFPDGTIRTTRSALEKVYYFIFNSNLTNAFYSGSKNRFYFEMNSNNDVQEGYEKVKLWEFLAAVYAIRNAAAHKGKFIREEAINGDWKNKLAAKYYSIDPKMFLNRLEGVVNEIINLQIKKNIPQ